jgi:Fe-S-cluster containining protein
MTEVMTEALFGFDIDESLMLDINVIKQWKNEINNILTKEVTEQELKTMAAKVLSEDPEIFVSENFGSFILPIPHWEQMRLLVLLQKITNWVKGKPKVKVTKFIASLVVDYHNLQYDLTEDSREKSTCRKACAFCCYQQVLMTNGEALLIKEYLRKNPDTYLNMERMKLHKSWQKNDKGSAWDHSVYSEKACPFLQPDNLCSIYPVRPLACRNHRSIESPELCDVENLGVKNVRFIGIFANALFLNALACSDELKPIAHYW